jgi:hypothetical protein
MSKRPATLVIKEDSGAWAEVSKTVIQFAGHWAKLNKPSPDIITSDWDRTVDLVVAAMLVEPKNAVTR